MGRNRYTATSQIKVGSWNLKFGQADSGLIADRGLDLLMIQEVKPDSFQRFLKHFSGGVHAMDSSLSDAPPAAGHGVALLWSDRFELCDSFLPKHMIRPHQFLVCDLAFVKHAGFFQACSFHGMNGEQGDDGFDKPRFTMQVAKWLEDQQGPVIIGMDANSPEVDHPDFARTECHFDWLGPRNFERSLLGPDARHRLVDVYRTWLEQDPKRMKQVIKERPEGPLAISHRSGSKKAGKPRRYDHILATRGDFQVVEAAYEYDGAIAMKSDHALVTATLSVELGKRKKQPPVPRLLPTRFS